MVNRLPALFVPFAAPKCSKLELNNSTKKPDDRFSFTRVFCGPAGPAGISGIFEIRGIFDLFQVFLETFVPVLEDAFDQVFATKTEGETESQGEHADETDEKSVNKVFGNPQLGNSRQDSKDDD